MEVTAPQTAPTTFTASIDSDLSKMTKGVVPGRHILVESPPTFQLPYPLMPQPLPQPQNIFQVFQKVMGMLLDLIRSIMQQSSPPAVQPYKDPSLQMYQGRPAPAAEALARAAGVKDLRVIPPGTMTTMDYRPGRLNLYLDASGMVTSAKWG